MQELFSGPSRAFYIHLSRKNSSLRGVIFPPSIPQKTSAFGMFDSVKPPEISGMGKCKKNPEFKFINSSIWYRQWWRNGRTLGCDLEGSWFKPHLCIRFSLQRKNAGKFRCSIKLAGGRWKKTGPYNALIFPSPDR